MGGGPAAEPPAAIKERMEMKKIGTIAGRATAVGALALLLGACANPQADQALYAQQAFVGMPAQTLLSCAGVPDRQATVDNLDYFTYSSERIVTRTTPAFASVRPYWHPYHGWRYSPAFGMGWHHDQTEIESRDCEATFTLRNGVVERVVYNSASAGPSARLGQCYQIVQTCLAQIPGQQVAQ